MGVCVDTNSAETPLYDAIKKRLSEGKKQIQILRSRLDLGDIKLEAANRTILLERKSWADWRASIMDGRYKEQKVRALGSMSPDTTYVYLLEGGIVGYDGAIVGYHGVTNKAANAAVIKTQLRDGLVVLRSKDTEHSAHMIAYIYEQLSAGTLEPQKAKAIAGVCKKRKRENMDDCNTLYRAMLQQIPGMSEPKAEAVAVKYTNFRKLRDANVKDLANIYVMSSASKGRALGPAVAKRIVGLF